MDPITDVILGGIVAEDVVAGVGSAIEAIETFLGFDGMQAAYDIIHGLGELEIRSIFPQLVFQDGGVVGLRAGQLIGFTAENAQNILSAISKISQILVQKGVDLSTMAGKDLLENILEKVKEYGPGLSSAALGTYIGNKVVNYLDNKKNQIEQKVDDTVSDIKNKFTIDA